MKIIASKDFTANGKEYIAGDEIKTKNFDAIVKLNEQGFIEPLTRNDLIKIKREINNPIKEISKEEI